MRNQIEDINYSTKDPEFNIDFDEMLGKYKKGYFYKVLEKFNQYQTDTVYEDLVLKCQPKLKETFTKGDPKSPLKRKQTRLARTKTLGKNTNMSPISKSKFSDNLLQSTADLFVNINEDWNEDKFENMGYEDDIISKRK